MPPRRHQQQVCRPPETPGRRPGLPVQVQVQSLLLRKPGQELVLPGQEQERRRLAPAVRQRRPGLPAVALEIQGLRVRLRRPGVAVVVAPAQPQRKAGQVPARVPPKSVVVAAAAAWARRAAVAVRQRKQVPQGAAPVMQRVARPPVRLRRQEAVARVHRAAAAAPPRKQRPAVARALPAAPVLRRKAGQAAAPVLRKAVQAARVHRASVALVAQPRKRRPLAVPLRKAVQVAAAA